MRRNWSKWEWAEMLLFAGPVTITCAFAGIAFALSFISMVIFPTRHDREYARRASCQSNLKQISLALRKYTQDNDQKMPVVIFANKSPRWVNNVLPYLSRDNSFQCPSQDNSNNTMSGELNSDYFFNARLSGWKTSKAAKFKNLILLAEGTSEKTPVFPHFDGANYAFADGHVKFLRPETISDSPAKKESPTFRVH